MMKAVVLYHPKSDHARSVEEFAHDFQRFDITRKIDLVSVDTREGAATATLYDVTRYPAVLALDNDGKLLSLWTDRLPLMNELAAYAH